MYNKIIGISEDVDPSFDPLKEKREQLSRSFNREKEKALMDLIEYHIGYRPTIYEVAKKCKIIENPDETQILEWDGEELIQLWPIEVLQVEEEESIKINMKQRFLNLSNHEE